MDSVVEVRHLTKKFGKGKKQITAVNDISFTIKKGEIVGLLGPNGAGKTTTLRMLLTFIIPDNGSISIFGKELFSHREEILKQVNFTYVNMSVGWWISVWETLQFFALLYEVKDAKRKIMELMTIFDIAHLKDKKTRELSSGEISRVALCKALINDPKLLLLDEPTSSLDPDIAEKTINLIKKIQRYRSMTILYTSHNMREVEEICDRIIFMHKGKIHISGTPVEITRKILQVSAHTPSMKDVFIKISRGDIL